MTEGQLSSRTSTLQDRPFFVLPFPTINRTGRHDTSRREHKTSIKNTRPEPFTTDVHIIHTSIARHAGNKLIPCGRSHNKFKSSICTKNMHPHTRASYVLHHATHIKSRVRWRVYDNTKNSYRCHVTQRKPPPHRKSSKIQQCYIIPGT